MGGGGGGGQSGGTVVGGPTPWAAQMAGMYQSQAAREAAAVAERSTKEAIMNMNKMYQQARYDVQPYRTTGVAALNQLNQYLQLPAYNPGPAPKAPKDFTVDSIASKLSNQQINDYINANTMPGSVKSGAGNANYWTYSGYGADDVNLYNRVKADWESAPAHGQAYSKYPGTVGYFAIPTAVNDSWMTGAQALKAAGQPYNLYDYARIGAAKEQYEQGLEGYENEVTAYERDLSEYNQNKALYDRYTAEGAYTQEQISDKIQNLPGYQAQLSSGIDAIEKNASARGYLGSGRLLKELGDYGQNTMASFYGNELNRLASLAGMGQQAATTTGQNAMAAGQINAGLHQSLGDTKANAALASGNALAQAIMAGNQQYQIIGGNDGGGGGGMGGLGSVLGSISQMAGMFSSKQLKDKINTPNTAQILNNVKELTLDRWKYKGLNNTHFGPYAEEFKERFGVGDGQTISIVDMFGVLLACIKEQAHQIAKLQEIK